MEQNVDLPKVFPDLDVVSELKQKPQSKREQPNCGERALHNSGGGRDRSYFPLIIINNPLAPVGKPIGTEPPELV